VKHQPDEARKVPSERDRLIQFDRPHRGKPARLPFAVL